MDAPRLYILDNSQKIDEKPALIVKTFVSTALTL